MSLHVFFGLLCLVALVTVNALVAVVWVKAMVDQFRQREWGFLAVFILLPLSFIGLIGWQVTK